MAKRITPAFIRSIEQNRKRMTITSICKKHRISLTQYHRDVKPYITAKCPPLTMKEIKKIEADALRMNLMQLRQKHEITVHQYNKYIKSSIPTSNISSHLSR